MCSQSRQNSTVMDMQISVNKLLSNHLPGSWCIQSIVTHDCHGNINLCFGDLLSLFDLKACQLRAVFLFINHAPLNGTYLTGFSKKRKGWLNIAYHHLFYLAHKMLLNSTLLLCVFPLHLPQTVWDWPLTATDLGWFSIYITVKLH